MAEKLNVYEIVTERILAQMAEGNIPWHKPWRPVRVQVVGRKTHTETYSAPCAYNRVSRKPYSGINQMLLAPGEWASAKQIAEAGGHINKGAKAHIAIYWKMWEKEKLDPGTGKPVIDPDTGKPEKDRIPMLRYYNIFNIERDTDLEPKPGTVTIDIPTLIIDDPGTEVEVTNAAWEGCDVADAIIRAYTAQLNAYTEDASSDRAFYRPATDSVVVPGRACYKSGAEFYSTTFHELGHSTGHKSRLDRFRAGADHSFGSEEYSKEELVAEMTAAAINCLLGIETKSSLRNSAGYIQSWSDALRSDPKLFVSAASKADKAVEWILTAGKPAVTAEA